MTKQVVQVLGRVDQFPMSAPKVNVESNKDSQPAPLWHQPHCMETFNQPAEKKKTGCENDFGSWTRANSKKVLPGLRPLLPTNTARLVAIYLLDSWKVLGLLAGLGLEPDHFSFENFRGGLCSLLAPPTPKKKKKHVSALKACGTKHFPMGFPWCL